MFPHGLRNSAVLASHDAHLLFTDSTSIDPISSQRTLGMHQTRHFINMVSVHTLPEDDTSSTQSSTGSIPTKDLHLEDDDYNMDFPPYPLGFPRFPIFLP